MNTLKSISEIASEKITNNANKIATVQTNVTDNTNKINSVQAGVTSNTNKLDTIQSSVTTNTNRISSLENVGIVGMYQSACNFYIKYNNGVLHQGTKVRVPAVPSNSCTTGSTNWLVPFLNADYNATGTMIADGGNTNHLRTLLTRSKDKIMVNLWNSNSVATGETYWTIQAMGRWK